MAFQNDSIFWVEVEKIVPNPYQPRREFDQSKLEELADSIRMYGVLQPLTVTRKEIQRDDESFFTEYELIAGERRLRASRLASIQLVPVIIREGEQNEQEKLELAIIENLQREDLNAVDRAMAFKQLADSFNLSHVQVAKKVGRSREYVANSIRLLALPEHMLQSLRMGELSEGHARTLLMLSDKPAEQDTVFREILLKKLSVREVERIARSIATDKVRKRDKNFDPELIEMEKRFTETLGTRVHIQKTEFGGKLTIDYFSPEDLTFMLERMKKEMNDDLANGRKPFAPPQELTEDAAQELEAVTDATPLSALIAQLQQAEAKDDLYTTPATAEPTVTASVPVEEVSQTVDQSPVAANEPASVAEQSPDKSTVTVITTNAPVSFVRSEAAGHSQRQPQEAYRPPEMSPVAAAPQRMSAPRVVAIRRDFTSAMYVAPATPAPAVEQSTVDTVESAPRTSADQATAGAPTQAAEAGDESSLYSIRNFNI